MNDETAVREMLHDLTFDQPAAPIDRVVGVRHRHVRRRNLQAAASTVATAAVVVGALLGAGVLTGGGSSKPKSLRQPPALSWQLPWPDRSDHSVRLSARVQGIKTHALAYLAGQSAPVRDVRWLFAGDVQDNARVEVDVQWAVFEASVGGPNASHELIAMSLRNNSRTWQISTQDAPPPTTQQIAFARSRETMVLIIAAPGVDAVRLSDLSSGGARILPRLDTESGLLVDFLDRAPTPQALLVGTPDLSSTFLVGFPGGSGRLPAWERALVSNAPPIAGYRRLSGVAGGVVPNDGFDDASSLRGYYGPMIEVIRCVGQAPLTLTITANGQTSSQSVDRCDGQSQTLHLGFFGHDGKYEYLLSGHSTAVYAMAVYVQKAK